MTILEIARIFDQAHALDHPRKLEALRVDVHTRWRGERAARIVATVIEERIAQLLKTN